MDLNLVHSQSDESAIYLNQLKRALTNISPGLISENLWDKEFVESTPQFLNKHVGAQSPIDFEGIPTLLALELKLHWAKVLSDPRMDAKSKIERRRLPMKWFKEEGQSILDYFGVESLAQIPHPEFPLNGRTNSGENAGNNRDLLAIFSKFGDNSKLAKINLEYVKNNALVRRSYDSPRITIVGDIHKRVLIQKEQFQPIHQRNLIFINDIYSEHNTRYKDLQRNNDHYLNFYLHPVWLRPAIREHTLQKVAHGELAPKTLIGYFGQMSKFRDFIHERFDTPSPADVTSTLIEDEFVAWGNSKGYVGKNWFTTCVAMLNTAARTWPDTWPSLSITTRASSKIDKVHYKKGLGRMGHNQEGAGRSYSQRIVDELRAAVVNTPSPISSVFSLILCTGMRSEDGHAVLFDCLASDPHDDEFMLLTFWQNKVSKWNVKPLHKKNDDHLAIIKTINEQRKTVLERYGKPAKYVFPVFNGSNESFLAPSYTRNEIKKVCIKSRILTDDGNALSFSWHPLRHTKGTSLASAGHDILSIMMELGHASPDMAANYINNRLELKKKALLENGGGRFYTIEGAVDEKVSELLVRKEQIGATRVCGGACSMPAQLGDWCEHANACYTCKHYRADEKDVEFFKVERAEIISIIEVQQDEVATLEEHGRGRMAEITQRRLKKNKDVFKSLDKIVTAIETEGTYIGTEQKYKQLSLEVDL